MKKVLFVILILAVAFSVTCCASGEVAESFSSDFNLNAEKPDYDGLDMDIYFSLASLYTPDIFMGFAEESLFYELVQTRISDIRKELNVDIGYAAAADSSDSIILRDSFAGEAKFGICIDESNRLIGSARTGLLVDYTGYSEYLDYTDNAKYGTRDFLKGSLWNGGIYGVLPFKWPIVPYSSLNGVMCANEKLIKQIGVTDPREFVENNTWTWDVFESQLPLYAHTNNADEYVYGFEATTHWLFCAMQASCGAGISYYENGQYNLSVNTPTVIDAFNRGLDWTYGDYAPYTLRNESWPAIRQDFIDEKSVTAIVVVLNIIQTTNSLAYELEDFAVLSFPHGPEAAVDASGACIWAVEGITSVPALFPEPELATTVISMLYEPLDGYETRDKLDDYMRRYFLYDDRDVACLDHNLDIAIYNYRNEGLTDMIININNSKTVQAWIDTYEKADETNRAKYLEVIEETADLLFGKSSSD